MARKKKAKKSAKKEEPAPKLTAPKPQKRKGGRRSPPTGVAVLSRIKSQAKEVGSGGSTREAKEAVKDKVDEFARELLEKANSFAGHRKRVRFNKQDVELANKFLTRVKLRPTDPIPIEKPSKRKKK